MLLVSKNNIIPLLKILCLSTSHRLTRTIQYRELATKETCIRKKKKFSNLTELIENKRDNCARQGREGEEIRTWSIVWRRKGWLRSREARQGAFSLAATKRRRFSPPLFLSLSFLLFSLRPPPSSSLLVEIPRGAHSIIRYLCRTRQERPVARKATVQETLTPFRSTSPVTLPHPPPNRCFAATHVANLAIFPPRNAIPIPKPDPSVKYLLSPSPD